MSVLSLRAPADCAFDLVALGEVMLRLDPGDVRIATARSFRVWEGGGEYNVARGIASCFELRAGIVTALADNPVGRLVEDLIRQGGVRPAHLGWVPYDGVGRSVRNGLNFVERGFGVRGALGMSDRGHTAVSQLAPGDVDWEGLFGHRGVRWLHCGGVFAALSESTAEVALEAMQAARRHGTIVSYDFNFRPSLWEARGSSVRATEVNRRLVEHVDVLIGSERDLAGGLGFGLQGVAEQARDRDPQAYRPLLAQLLERVPSLSVVATTLRHVRTASANDWSAVAHTRDGFDAGPRMDGIEIYDRIGSGDAFASGFFYGLLTGEPVETALALGVAHGALAMTTPGDCSMATLPEVRRLAAGETAGVIR